MRATPYKHGPKIRSNPKNP